MSQDKLQKIVALAKRRGFIFPGSEIYGGLANTYDYGPLGTQLLKNIKDLWWKNFIQQRSDMVGIDSSIILHPKVWKASGHVDSFTDAMVDCKECRHRTRADHLIENYFEKEGKEQKVEGKTVKELDQIIKENNIPCPSCNEFNWTDVRQFNLLFETNIGIISGNESKAYLRGETAQGIFINFRNIIDSTRVKIPFGVGQVGKSFRNEITLGNFIFRTMEFEQAEIEYFFNPEKTEWEPLFEDWKKSMWQFVTNNLGINEENLRWRVHPDEERSFYSKRTEDLEYNFPFGFKELWGIAYRTDYDLKQHQEMSGQDLTVQDTETKVKFLPHVIEPAVGINRLALMALLDAYTEDEGRVLLKLHKDLAPYKAAVFPLVSNKPELVEKAQGLYDSLKTDYMVAWDDRGNIGKRYASQDEIGTPYCITIDYHTLEDNTVTLRDRDTAAQTRISVDKVANHLQNDLQ